MKEQETQKADPFYDEDYTGVEEINLDEALAQPVMEDELVMSDEDSREDWQLTEDEDRLLADLLKKKENEDHIMKTYKALEDRPSEEVLEGWKKQFGDIFLVSLSEKENFIFRALRRQEWRQLVAQIQKFPEQKKAEAICMRGIIFPKMTEMNMATLTAGAPETIRNLILEASNFIEPERAITLVRKL